MIDAAVIGVGQTKYDSKRRDVSVGGLVREAIDNAMKIKVHLVDIATIGVDIPEDLKNLSSQL